MLQWHTPDRRRVHAQLPYELTGKTVGAGDALVAAALAILAERLPGVPGHEQIKVETLAETLLTPADLPALVATAAASVKEPVAGRLSPAIRDQLLADATCVEL
ncbi:hypothetical protein BSZ39_03035 [Bowdeniella nasicola]|uniref:Uncharacterized protein n=1 Tax=Bowdeniella nasicola TaxID=208480 RepID=A0A1Q5Q4D2_9ACTO|nr:hypothetical protein [Bowdeniella nasicola]OKL54675.1 hypothetical protein BSZ39_03035 [Bowdeniella nasicola]